MTSYLLAGPAEEPVSLARAKAYLRLEDEAEDGLVETLVAAARLHVESITGRALLTQSWRMVLDTWPESGVLILPVTPVTAIDSVRVYDEDGEPAVLEASQFAFDARVTPARLLVPANLAGTAPMRRHRAIEIDFTAGFGDEPEDVPTDLVHAMMTLIGHWFEHRDAVVVAGAGAVVPAGFDRLVTPYKRVRL